MRMRFSLDYLIQTVKRFPVAVLFALVTTIVSICLNHQEPMTFNEPFFRAAYIGFLLAVIAVIIYERFFASRPEYFSWLLQAVALPVAAIVYFIAPETEEIWRTDYIIRTNVILFLLLVCIVWLPTIKNATLTFGQHFVILFKSFFITVLFSAVLGFGASLVLGAWDLLLSPVDSNLYSDIYSVVAYLFAPLYMLSLQSPYTIPYRTEPNKVDDTIHRLFDIILTKISIPIITILSFILLAFVMINFTEISNNELETILISYVIFGWVFLFLIHAIDRPYIRWFKRGFLVTLFIVSLFQFVRSIQYAMDFGMTHNRYFVLLFCIVSAAAVVLYVRWPQLIPAVVMAALVISLIPPIDALSVGARSQTEVLTQTVAANDPLLVNGELQVTDENVETVSSLDAQRILESARYLDSRDRLSELPFIPADFDAYDGINELASRIDTDTQEGSESPSYYVSLDQEEAQVLDVTEEQYMVMIELYTADTESIDQSFTAEGHEFEARFEGPETLVIEDLTDGEEMTFNFSSFREYSDLSPAVWPAGLPLEDLTFENETASFEAELVLVHFSVFEEGSSGGFLLMLTPK